MNGTIERRLLRLTVLALSLAWVGSTFLGAAPPQSTANPSEAAASSFSQQQLINFLAAHPDRLQELARQPRLLQDKGYLRQHPELAAFLNEHPEIAPQPGLTAGLPVPSEVLSTATQGNWRDTVGGPCGPALKVQALQYELDRARNDRSPRPSSFARLIDVATPFLVFVVIVAALLQILKITLQNRRWGRVAKVQSEAHTKLLEKFGTSQELLAYMGTEAGKRFLESQPLEVEAQEPRATPYPFRRILLSIQLGVVVLLAGLGLLFLRGHVSEEAEGCLVLGTLASTVGVGFLLSAAASYGLSQHLGLLEGVTSKRQ
jgi:uncharacterized protein YhhL (DUF1145 family)